jgi:hypothetical protein
MATEAAGLEQKESTERKREKKKNILDSYRPSHGRHSVPRQLRARLEKRFGPAQGGMLKNIRKMAAGMLWGVVIASVVLAISPWSFASGTRSFPRVACGTRTIRRMAGYCRYPGSGVHGRGSRAMAQEKIHGRGHPASGDDAHDPRNRSHDNPWLNCLIL